jgi:hypothetical protein
MIGQNAELGVVISKFFPPLSNYGFHGNQTTHN